MTMKRFLIIAALAISTLTVKAGSAVFNIKNAGGKPVFFQPQDSSKFITIASRDTTFSYGVDKPRYFNLVIDGSRYLPLFCTQGSTTTVTIAADGSATLDGTFKSENTFMQQHPFNCTTPQSIAPYSREWTEYNEKVLATRLNELHASDLNAEFKKVHAAYLSNTFLYQRINGAQTSLTFSPEISQKIELAPDYYDFLKDVKFDDPLMLSYPKWFDTIDKSFEEMERHGFIPTSPDSYMSVYARSIIDPTLRSQYIVSMVELSLRKGYYADVINQYDDLISLTTDDSLRNRMTELKAIAEKAKAADKLIGAQLPFFTGNTVDGKSYTLADFKGKYIVLDFWFTGCVPCKAEMPYYDRLADELAATGIQFLSISLDTGSQLMATWKKMMTSRAPSNVLYLNIPGGFKSDFIKQTGIKSVPRLMIVDKDGTIIDSCAKRPSDPKLKAKLSSLK